MKNVHCYGSSGGISVSNTQHGSDDHIVIQNITLMNIKNTGSTAMSIDLDSMSDAAERRSVTIQNLNAFDVNRCVYIGKNWDVTFQNVCITKMDDCFDVQAGSSVVATNCHFDFTGSTGAAYVCLMRSDATYGGSEWRFLDYPTIVKGGASNRPSAVFHEQDTTANKTVWMPGAYDIDGGFTATIGRTSGHTTLIAATDCNAITL